MTAVAGPADRETFFAARARHRRASWKLAAVCTLAVVLLGIPVAMVISPLVTGAAILLFDLLNPVVPTPNLLAALATVLGCFMIPLRLMPVVGLPHLLPRWIGG